LKRKNKQKTVSISSDSDSDCNWKLEHSNVKLILQFEVLKWLKLLN
jgi:hypothetical protein